MKSLAILLFSASTAFASSFDLASLPSYKWEPGPQYERGLHCHNDRCDGEWGVIRIHGSELQQGLIHRWQDHFLKRHPNIRYNLYTVPNGFSGITTGTV